MSQVPNSFSNGAVYERHMGRWSRAIGQQFLSWLDAPKAAAWVDVGCGNGAFTEEIIARAAPSNVTGIDPSDSQIEFARSRIGTTSAQFHVGDAQALPFADASFDVAIMALVIAFVPDPVKGVAELLRVTKIGGQVAAYMWELPAGAPLHPMVSVLNELGKPMTLPPSSKFSHMEAMTKLWESAGLIAVESKVIRTTISFTSFDDFWESNLLTGPLTKHVSELAAEVRTELRDRLLKCLPIARDGSISYDCFANAVKGKAY